MDGSMTRPAGWEVSFPSELDVVYIFDNLQLDRELFELRRDGLPVRLEPKVMDLLLYLVEHRHRLLSKSELLETVWAGHVVTESSLTRCISQARSAIGEGGRRGRILTVHGRGYRFEGDVEELSVDTGATSPPGPGKEPSVAARRRAASVVRIGAAVAAALVLALAAYAWVSGGGRTSDRAPVSVAGARAVSPDLEKRLRARGLDPQANQAYLMGNLRKAVVSAPETLAALGLFQKAVLIDPAHAPAHAAIAGSYVQLGWGLHHLPPREAMPKARAAAEAALRLDPSLVGPLLQLGIVLGRYEWRWQDAESSFLRAAELDPGAGPGHYGLHLIAVGRHDEGLALIERQIDPLLPRQRVDVRAVHALALSYSRCHERAIEEARKTIPIHPDLIWSHAALVQSLLALGRSEAAHRAYADLLRLRHGDGWLRGYEEAYVSSGLPGSLRYVLEESGGLLHSVERAELHALLGEKELAFSRLLEAAEERNLDLGNALANSAALDPLRPDPRFEALLRRINHPLAGRSDGRALGVGCRGSRLITETETAGSEEPAVG